MPGKQVIFIALTLLVVPAAAWLGIRYRWAERLLVVGAFLSTAYLVDINFVSMESYRGDTRGFEFGVTDWMIIALIVTMTCSPRWRRERLQLLPPNSGPLLAYLGVALLSLAFAYVPLYAGFGLSKLVRAVAVYWVAFNYLRSERDLRFLILVLVAMVGVQFSLVLWQRAAGLYRAVGSTPHPNTLAVYVNFMNMVFLAFVLGEKRRSLHTWAAWAGLVMGAVIVLATFSRGALLTMGLGFAIVVTLSLWDRPRASKFTIIGMMMLVAVAGAVKVAPSIIQRFETAPVESGLSRQQANSAALAMARDHFFGVGLNNYSYVVNSTPYSGYIPLESDRGIVHNVYLLHASELGWLGLAAFLVVIARFLWLAVRFILRRRDDVTSSMAIGIFAGMVALWTQSLLEWLFRQTYVTVEFFLLAGLLAALPRVARRIHVERIRKVLLLRQIAATT
jgi:O-antigen ligase